ncbi:MAG: ATP-dependent helicase [Acidimicrobiaceae bacterium]|nr:ATP-dependent helicase [Acidimicrobiaceae bacterium]MYE75051.1 ATP-dependent helicase [Acidimicrobiaceae bacterium]MYH44915.1 ATP-dependent helicase [Acidimicrobiaceae bacterium]MYJ42251.1 ATP-dependent helicase [Acidimicrobiaceae bacterium]
MAEPEHPLLEGLTPEQRDAVTTRASPLCVIAGAGSGKTRVLTRRIAWQAGEGHADPRRTLAVTFTRRAARELRWRLRRLGLNDAVRAGTFHAVALAQLRRHAADSGRRPPRILENTGGLVSELRPRTDRATVAGIANEIGWCRARLVSPEDYPPAARAAGRRPPVGRAERFVQLYADYESAKRKRRLLDFDDVLARSLEVMETEPKHAAAHRWLHQHLLVDEFQDINPLQFALLKSWLGPDSTLVVVGDPDQAIYGWNGADPELINTVGSHLPGCAVLHMRANFRSTPEILAAAGRILGRASQPAVRPSGEDPTVTVCDGAGEAAVLARAVRQRHRPGSTWRRQAVLARTNAQLDPLRKALVRQNIPVATVSEGSLLRRPEIAALREAWAAGASLASCAADARQRLREPADAGGDPQKPAAPDTPEARASVEAFLDFAEDHLSLDPDSTVGAFITALRADSRLAPSSDGVDLMTFHAAKGLEWPVVHLVGLEDGLVPIAHARTAAARAEERRLLHVAVTRAEQELHVLWCDRRDLGGKTVEREPSPWLEAIGGSKSLDDAEVRRLRNLEGVKRARRAKMGSD